MARKRTSVDEEQQIRRLFGKRRALILARTRLEIALVCLETCYESYECKFALPMGETCCNMIEQLVSAQSTTEGEITTERKRRE